MSVNSVNQRAFATLSGIPYFSQWEDPDCAAGIIAGELELSDIKL